MLLANAGCFPVELLIGIGAFAPGPIRGHGGFHQLGPNCGLGAPSVDRANQRFGESIRLIGTEMKSGGDPLGKVCRGGIENSVG